MRPVPNRVQLDEVNPIWDRPHGPLKVKRVVRTNSFFDYAWNYLRIRSAREKTLINTHLVATIAYLAPPPHLSTALNGTTQDMRRSIRLRCRINKTRGVCGEFGANIIIFFTYVVENYFGFRSVVENYVGFRSVVKLV